MNLNGLEIRDNGSTEYQTIEKGVASLAQGRTGLKGWVTHRQNRKFFTLQIGPDGRGWSPGWRTVNTITSGKVVFEADGKTSTRELAGIITLEVSDTAIHVFNRSMETHIYYFVRDER